jgi:hypothetical protein
VAFRSSSNAPKNVSTHHLVELFVQFVFFITCFIAYSLLRIKYEVSVRTSQIVIALNSDYCRSVTSPVLWYLVTHCFVIRELFCDDWNVRKCARMWHADTHACVSIDISCVFLIPTNNQLDARFLLYTFISILYMFRATLCSSSGESIVSIQNLVYVSHSV